MSYIIDTLLSPGQRRGFQSDRDFQLDSTKAVSFYGYEHALLSEKFHRVDLTTGNSLPMREVIVFHMGHDPKVHSAFDFDPLPIAVLSKSSDERFKSSRSFFFESEEDAVLFKLKYEGKL